MPHDIVGFAGDGAGREAESQELLCLMKTWSLPNILVVLLVVVAALLAWGTLMYLSFKAWVWTIVELAKYWGYLA